MAAAKSITMKLFTENNSFIRLAAHGHLYHKNSSSNQQFSKLKRSAAFGTRNASENR